MIRDELCRAFCDEIKIKKVPVGLAVSTPFRRSDGDAVSFYVIQNETAPAIVHLEDDGQTMPYLEACGVDFDTLTRKKALEALLAEYGAEYDETENIIRTRNLKQDELPQAALAFVALILRLYDFLLLTQDHVESTFKEDAAKGIKEAFGPRAKITESQPVSPKLAELPPDMVVQAPNRRPVAIFFSQSATRVNEAIILQMSALYEAKEPLSVVVLLERENSISREMYRRAGNRLSAVTTWDEREAAMKRIEREVVGTEGLLH